MNKRLSYTMTFLVLLGLPAILIAYFLPGEINITALIAVAIICQIIGGIFIVFATKQNKKDKFYIWEYSRKTTLGIKFLGVPIEEWLFFLILTPLCIILLYEGVSRLLSQL